MQSVASAHAVRATPSAARGAWSAERVARSGTRRAERVKCEERVVHVNHAVQVHEIQQ